MKKHLRYSIFAAIIIVVVGASAAAAILLSPRNDSSVKKTNEKTPTAQQAHPAEQKADEASKLAYAGDVQAGVDVLDAAIKGSSDTHAKFIYYSQKAILLFNNKNLDGALLAAKQAFELEQAVDSAAFVGQIARAKGDRATALDYYKKALALVDVEGNPMGQRDKEYYTGIVAELEGGN